MPLHLFSISDPNDIAEFEPDSKMSSAFKAILNYQEEDECEIRGFKTSPTKCFLAHLVSILMLGIPYLVGHWKPEWRVRWFNLACPIYAADKILVSSCQGGDSSVEEVKVIHVSEDFPERYTVRRRSNSRSNSLDTTRLLSEGVSFRPHHRYFHHLNSKYVWDNQARGYVRIAGLPFGTKTLDLHGFQGFSADLQSTKQLLFGLNVIDVEVKSYAKLLFQEVLNPFYIFQICSIILWSCDQYVFYATCIFLISLLSVVVSLIETRGQSIALHNMVASSNDHSVLVCRGKRSSEEEEPQFEEIPAPAVVPGDVISIPPNGCLMACDAVLLSGTCIVNESMLTGESVPVTKAALPLVDPEADEAYHPEVHKRHTLFAGTTVIQTRYYGSEHVLAVVTRTGFSTSKGELIRSIMYPKPIGFKFYRDSMRFILVLFFIALIGMSYCVYVYVKRGSDYIMILLRCLDIITIVVPPALPAAMTVGTYYAQNRLKKQNIFCLSPQRINMCGKTKLFCFDKTGTLTEDGLDMWGVVDLDSDKREFQAVTKDVTDFKTDSKVLNCLASCHSLTVINGDLCGDPLDIKMFESTRWGLEESGKEDTSKFDMLMPTVVRPLSSGGFSDSTETDSEYPFELGIIRQFTFSSSVARMSVITRTLGGSCFDVFTKGAPEKLEEMCIPESLPKDFHEKLRQFTLQGFRVIGLAHRVLPNDINWLKIQKLKREQVERDLTFLGFLIMQNTLKIETSPVIKELKQADVRCVMVTGDNLLTAISVARDCKMVDAVDTVFTVEASAEKGIQFKNTERVERRDPLFEEEFLSGSVRNSFDIERGFHTDPEIHLAMTGKTWAVIRDHFPHMIPRLIVKGTVFARMGPDQKAQLVESLQTLDYIVGMCGDGANDCGALKAAHVGISLSEAEASVAAPFTSRTPNITCVPQVIKEGRCALTTSFGVFKYMALYSMIQFISVLTLYTKRTNLGDTQFLYIDLAITTTVAVLMGRTEAHTSLVKKRPPGSLVSGTNLASIVVQILVVLFFQVGSYLYLTGQSWFVPNDPPTPESEIILCWETTTIFLISSYQYLILATAFSKGPPYRRSFFTNLPFLASLSLLTVTTAVLTVYPGKILANFFEIEFDPDNPTAHMQYRLGLLTMAFFNALISLLIEMVMVESRWLKSFTHLLAGKKMPKNKFKIIQRRIRDEHWPHQHSTAESSPAESSISNGNGGLS